MPKPADIRDPNFRSALEQAERFLDDGDYTKAAQTCADAYLQLLAQHQELLPPPDLPETQPLDPQGRPLVAEGTPGLARIDAARLARRNWWPGTGAISVVIGPDRRPQLRWAKDRVSLSEAAGYFEFLVQQLADAERAS